MLVVGGGFRGKREREREGGGGFGLGKIILKHHLTPPTNISLVDL